jgi:hypothetical protein
MNPGAEQDCCSPAGECPEGQTHCPYRILQGVVCGAGGGEDEQGNSKMIRSVKGYKSLVMAPAGQFTGIRRGYLVYLKFGDAGND